MKNDIPTEKKRINLALQGGGAHGAFTWGVLDRLLEEKNLEITGVSGTSAGGVNGTLLVYGLLTGGPDKARDLLNQFWHNNSMMSLFSPLQPTPLDRMLSKGNMDYNPFYKFFRQLSSVLTPEQINPMKYNPISDLMNNLVDFDVIRKNDKIKLFLSAVNVKTSKIKVFDNSQICTEAVLASACLPYVFPTIEIEGEHYWDGGYIGNPALFPLFQNTDCSDLLVVQIDSTHYDKIPATAGEIIDRATVLGFNSSLMRELRAVNFVNEIIDKGFDDQGNLKKIHLHLVHTGDALLGLNSSSKMNTSWPFLTYLRDYGRSLAGEWIKKNYDRVGKETTFDVQSYIY